MTTQDISVDLTLNSGNSYSYASAWRNLDGFDGLSVILLAPSQNMTIYVDFASSATPASFTSIALDVAQNLPTQQQLRLLGSFYKIRVVALTTATASLMTRLDSSAGPSSVTISSLPNIVVTPNTIYTNTALGSTVVAPATAKTRVKHIHVYNPSQLPAFLHLFDVASAGGVTLGATTPKCVFAIPAGTALNTEINTGFNNGVSAVGLTGSGISAGAAPSPPCLLTLTMNADSF